MKIKKGDEVLVIRGKDRGKKGKIIRVSPSQERIVVDGLNMRKRHRRARRQGAKGETVLMPGPLPAANARLICPACAKPTRVGYRIEGDKKVRICKKCKSILN